MRNISVKGGFRSKITQMQKAAGNKVERGAFTNLFDAEIAQSKLNREFNNEGIVVEDLLEDSIDEEEYDDVFDDFDVSDLSSVRDIDIDDIHFTGDEDDDFDELDEDLELDEDDDDDMDEDDLEDEDLDDYDDLDEIEDDDDDEDLDYDEDDEDYDDEDDEEELADTMFLSYSNAYRILKNASAAPGITYAHLPVEDQWTLLESAHSSDTSLREYNSNIKRINKNYSPKRDVKVSVKMCAMLDRDGDICGDASSIVCRNQRTGSTYGLCQVHKSIAQVNRNLIVKELRGGSKEDELNIKTRKSSRRKFEADDEVPNTKNERRLEKVVKNRRKKTKKSRRDSERTMVRKSTTDEMDFSGQEGILSGDLSGGPKRLRPGSFSNIGGIFK